MSRATFDPEPTEKVQSLAIRRENNVASVVMSRRNPGDDLLRLARCLEVAVLIAKSDHAVAVGDVDPSWIGANRIECDAEGLVQTTRINDITDGFGAAGRDPQDVHLVEHAVGDEQIPVGRDADYPRLVQF